MKVSVDISPEYREPYAVIHTDKVTEEIQRMIDFFSVSEAPITALQNEEDIVVLQSKEIYMVRVENGDTVIYGEKNKYRSRKRLYELGAQLGSQFMQIQLAVAFIIWFCFMRFYRREAREMNDKIQQMK